MRHVLDVCIKDTPDASLMFLKIAATILGAVIFRRISWRIAQPWIYALRCPNKSLSGEQGTSVP